MYPTLCPTKVMKCNDMKTNSLTPGDQDQVHMAGSPGVSIMIPHLTVRTNTLLRRRGSPHYDQVRLMVRAHGKSSYIALRAVLESMSVQLSFCLVGAAGAVFHKKPRSSRFGLLMHSGGDGEFGIRASIGGSSCH
jgi:hypothetical protein